MPQSSSFNLQILSPLSELSAMSINEVEGSIEPLDEDECEVVAGPEADDDDVDPMALGRIWDDNKIQKVYDPHGKHQWKCLYCQSTFAGHNATKALAHVSRSKGFNIAACKSHRFIPAKKRQSHQDLFDRQQKAKKRRTVTSSALSQSISAHQDDLTFAVQAARKRPYATPTTASTPRSVASAVSTTSGASALTPCSLLHADIPQTFLSVKKPPVKTPPVLMQLSIHDGPNPSGEAALTASIADMIHSSGLPFSLSTDPKFRRMIKLARNVGTNFITPSRHRIGTDLLLLNYDMYVARTKKELLNQADTYGLTLYGDGATVKKMPLINILCAGAHNPAAVLEIVNCSSHLQKGDKKDASYIASLFRPHLLELDPYKTCIDLIYFDGASNVQKAGGIISAYYPRVTCLHGAEHVVSLFFSDISKLSPIKTFIRFYRRVYKWFGSGSHHAPYAIFKNHSKSHHNQALGLIRAADTRMAGHFIAFQRMLRLKNAILSTLASSEFINLKVAKEETKLLKDDLIWQCLADIVRAAFPALRVLRLADKKNQGMDKLYYYVRKTDVTLTTQANDLNKIASAEVKTKLKTFFKSYENDTDSVSGDDDDSDGDSDDDADGNDKDNDDAASVDSVPSVDLNTVMEATEDGYMYGNLEQTDISQRNLVAQFRQAWGRRRKKLVHDYSITGWMLSPIPVVMEDAAINHTGFHRNAVDRLITKLFAPSTDYNSEADRAVAVGHILNTFWTEHEHFHAKCGPYANRQHIWISQDLTDGNSHLWHKKNSLRYTSILGKLACLVCSKILGIGSAERSWGDVKHLKTDKRAKLSGESTKMQSTIFGASCAERARIKQTSHPHGESINTTWDDADFADPGLDVTTPEVVAAPKQRIFRAWLEDWEMTARAKQDPVHEAQFLLKYGGLVWFDPDLKKKFMASSERMHWSAMRGTRGYCLLGLLDTYDPSVPDEKDWEPWVLDPEVLHCLIVEYYEKNPSPNIVVVVQKEANADDDNTEEDDE